MKYIKIFKYFAMLLVVALASFSFASCGDDDDDVSIKSPLVGTWKNPQRNKDGYFHIVFNSNGTGKHYTLEFDGKTKQEVVSFSWEKVKTNTSGEAILITDKDGDIEQWLCSFQDSERTIMTVDISYFDGSYGTRKRFERVK